MIFAETPETPETSEKAHTIHTLKKLLPFMEKARRGDKHIAFIDIILEFIEVQNLNPKYVSEAIEEDEGFKQMLKDDCMRKGILREPHEVQRPKQVDLDF